MSDGPRFRRSTHLVDLIAEAERLAAVVTSSLDRLDDELRRTLLDDAAVATLQLDGSPMAEPPVAAATTSHAAATPAPSAEDPNQRREGTWLDAFRLGEEDDTSIQAAEFVGARSVLEADDLVAEIVEQPAETITELHRRLTRGLVAPDRAGELRTSDQAVQDASVGRIIYFAADPTQIARRMAMLDAWLSSAGAREHALVVSGIAHHELLAVHPFESANGRVARAAARLVLRARELDPAGVTAFERSLAADPLGYHEEVARTLRRRDLTIWLERWGDAVTEGLRAVLARLGVDAEPPPGRAVDFLAGWAGSDFTIADYRAGAAVGPEAARVDLTALLDAGMIRRKPGSRGLRFLVASYPR